MLPLTLNSHVSTMIHLALDSFLVDNSAWASAPVLHSLSRVIRSLQNPPALELMSLDTQPHPEQWIAIRPSPPTSSIPDPPAHTHPRQACGSASSSAAAGTKPERLWINVIGQKQANYFLLHFLGMVFLKSNLFFKLHWDPLSTICGSALKTVKDCANISYYVPSQAPFCNGK